MPRPPAVTIRLARPADVDIVTALRVALRREERAVSIDPVDDDTTALRMRTRRQLASGTQAFFLAEAQGDAAGVLRVALVAGAGGAPHAMLTTAYVTPAHRRHGVMRRLVEAAEAWCRARDVPEMRLRNHAGNATAEATWGSLGFATVQVLRRRRLVP